jgi:hypothetical protein
MTRLVLQALPDVLPVLSRSTTPVARSDDAAVQGAAWLREEPCFDNDYLKSIRAKDHSARRADVFNGESQDHGDTSTSTERDKRSLASAAQLVDLARHQLLSAAALALKRSRTGNGNSRMILRAMLPPPKDRARVLSDHTRRRAAPRNPAPPHALTGHGWRTHGSDAAVESSQRHQLEIGPSPATNTFARISRINPAITMPPTALRRPTIWSCHSSASPQAKTAGG